MERENRRLVGTTFSLPSMRLFLKKAAPGKSDELKEQSRILRSRNQFSFFLAVKKDCENAVETSLTTAQRDHLEAWRSSDEPAWFFVDSTDEAKEAFVSLGDALERLAENDRRRRTPRVSWEEVIYIKLMRASPRATISRDHIQNLKREWKMHLIKIAMLNKEIVISGIVASENEGPEEIKIPVSQIQDEGSSNIQRRIGTLILNSLKILAPRDFDDLEEPIKSAFGPSSPVSLAHTLIQQSISEKTAVHIPSITYLLQRDQENRDASDFFNNAWPIIKELIEQQANDRAG